MIDCIIMNQSQTEATIWFTNGRRFGISTDAGDLIDLIVFFTSPFKSVDHALESMARLKSSTEDTQIIELSQFETEKAV